MKSATLMTILLLAVTGTAEPILWYHFDEGPAGTKAVTDTGAIVNAANPGTLNGTVKGVEWDGTSAIVKQNISYTNALDVATAWYDPVSGAKGDTTGIYVSITDPVIGSGSSGLVTVPDDGSLQVNRFTVEFFFRKEAGTAFKNGPVYPIQLYNSSTNTVAWQIALGKYSNAIVVNAHTRAGKLRTKRYENLWFGDGCWHHIAMTYDGTQLELFFDYKSLGAFDCELEYAENVSKSLMAIGNNYRVKLYRYHGRLDEVRLCDEVLTVDQFLRPMPLLCDADTLVYVSGKTSGLADFGGFGKTNNLNEVWNGQTVVPTIMYVGRLPSSEDSVPSATVRSDLYATNVVADASSLFFETNAAASEVGRTARLELNDVVGGRHTLLTNDAMTIEFFIKPSPQAADCNNNKYLIGCHTGLGCHSLFIRKGDHAA